MKVPGMRTSLTHPLQIAEIRPAAGHGLLGLSLCPGKQQPHAATGAWSRDLDLDLDLIAAWNAAVVVTLVEHHELERLQVQGMGEAVLARHMDWLHLPIRDQGVPGPGFEEAWSQAGPGLRSRLRAGANVFVHCMGGLGRAGTITARLLVELGWDAEEAIAHVRKVRPGAIETTGQFNHVLGQLPQPEPQPDTSIEAIRDRALGAMLGLAVGPFRLSAGTFTDDTSMALALADSLLERGGLDEADLMRRFVAWHERGDYSPTGTCFDIGITVRQALARFKRTGDPTAGSTDPMSAGNGSLMRLAPVAVRYWSDRAAMRDVAARQSRTTHGAPEAVHACVAYAELIADAMEGKAGSEVLAGRVGGDAGNIASIVAGSWRGKHRDQIRASGYVAHICRIVSALPTESVSH
jgi:ADP-ribosyl-[dinitrogen reductase] hydrolase